MWVKIVFLKKLLKFDMENVLEILNYLGINTSQTDPNIKPFVILFSSILFLTLLSLLSFTNILIYKRFYLKEFSKLL